MLPKSKGEEVGVVTHYFNKLSVGIIKLKKPLKVGDKIHIKGAHDDFTQGIKSMQHDHKDISLAKKGLEIGIKVSRPVHENDKVYKL
ncbi:MAG: translation elongation factor-like protein [Candidatus Omnitrophica bacterium]|nr:translation elongation factor-like protein [Candidatus Omnitrophota bacterium]